MKTPLTITQHLLAALTLLICPLLPGSARAQSPSPSPSLSPQPQSIDPFVKKPAAAPDQSQPTKLQSLLFTVELYDMKQGDAAQLLELSGAGEARHDAVLKLVKDGKAHLETLLSCGNASGERSVLECTDAVQFGTNYTGGDVQAPSAFEARNVGDTIEFETEHADANRCDLNVVLSRVRLLGFPSVYMHLPTKVVQARFQSAKMVANMSLDIGKTEFLGTLSGPPASATPGNNPPEDMIQLAFGRINALDLGEVQTNPANPGSTSRISSTAEVTLVYYSLDRETARQILSADTSSIYKAVKVLAGKNEANLERTTVLKALSGQRATTEELNEVRYPTQFNNTPSQPMSFEVCQAGVTLEVEPTFSTDGKVVSLSIVPILVSYLGDMQEVPQAAPRPIIEYRKITTVIKAPTGQYALLGTASDPGDNGVNGRKDTGRTWLCFARTSAP